MKKFLFALLLVAVTAAAWAADVPPPPPAGEELPKKAKAVAPPSVGPKVDGLELIPGDTVVKADDKLIVVTAKSKGLNFRWLVLGTSDDPEKNKKGAWSPQYVNVGSSIVVAAPAAGEVIYVFCVTSVDNVPTDHARTILSGPAGPPLPNPNPGPGPGPGPGPAPVGGPVTAVIVDDAAKRRLGQFPYMAQIVQSAGLRDSVTKGGHKLRVIDVSDGRMDANRLRPHLPASGAPALLLIQGTRVVKSVPCPQTPNEIVALINEVVSGGKR